MTPHTRQFMLNLSGGFVAVTILLTMAFIAWALVYREIPKGNETTLVQFVGALQALAGLIVGFFFGSSHTNKQQADTIDKLASTAQVAQESLTHPQPTVRLDPGESATVKASE